MLGTVGSLGWLTTVTTGAAGFLISTRADKPVAEMPAEQPERNI